MRRVFITGGLSRPNAAELDYGTHYMQGSVLRLDLESGEVERILTREPNADCYPPELPSILFTVGTRLDGELILPTNTEILIYGYPDMQLRHSVSYPFFNEIHHVGIYGDHIVVSSTGLDLVVVLDRRNLEPVAFANALGKDPWGRFSRDVDYRKVNSTKPHESHPNHTFMIGDELWVTRFEQKDAVALMDHSRRIDIGVELPHDGLVVADKVYFTTVNGTLVRADTGSLQVERVFDLNQLEARTGPLGWCRGLLIDGDIAYIGFSRLRDTQWKDNVRWARNLFTGGALHKTRIVAYDLARGVKQREYPLPGNWIDAVFGILPAD